MFINVRMCTQPSLCVWKPRRRQLWGSGLAFHLLSCSCHSAYVTATPWELQSNPPVFTSHLDVGVNRIRDDSSLQVLGSKPKARDLHCTHLPAEPSPQSKFYFLKQYSSYTSSGTQSNFTNFYFLKIYSVTGLKRKWLHLEWHDHGWSRGAQVLPRLSHE